MRYLFLVLTIAVGCATSDKVSNDTHYCLDVVCKHLNFMTYSQQDTQDTISQVQNYNQLYAAMCPDWLTLEEKEQYSR